jgi:hypothetical protein
MNTAEKEKQQKVISLIIEGINFQVQKIVGARNEYREAINKLTAQNDTYNQEYIERKNREAKDGFQGKMQTMYTDMVGRLEQLRKLVHDRDLVLDLSNPALTNALSLIQAIGGDLSYEEAVKINANFVNDQSGLRAIRAAYKSHGVLSQGNIDEVIYNIDDKINRLLDLAEAGTVMDSTMNGFSSEFSKLAALEGVTVEATADMVGADNAAWRAAGFNMPI